MIITIKNVTKKLMNREVKCDIHFYSFMHPDSRRCHTDIFETDERGITRQVMWMSHDISVAYETLCEMRGFNSVHILRDRLAILSVKKSQDVLLSSDSDVFKDDMFRVVPCQMHDYNLIGKRHTSLAIQQINDTQFWGFAYAYKESISLHTKLIEGTTRQIHLNALGEDDDETVDIETLIHVFGQKIIEY